MTVDAAILGIIVISVVVGSNVVGFAAVVWSVSRPRGRRTGG